ncbi:MAG: hypothetical protein H7062_19970 [Candidatus Saccharimonas sp.]|nr:hypothetical protein [Planctomycetaceae bacterium]
MPLPIRIAADTLPALIAGALLLGFAIVSAWLQIRHRRALSPFLEEDDLARTYADRQLRRRLQVSAMLGIVGILIPLGDQLEPFFRGRPGLFFVYWMAVLILVAWTVLMALGDWMSSAAYSSLANIQLRVERSRLEEEVRRYRASQNGHATEEESE